MKKHCFSQNIYVMKKQLRLLKVYYHKAFMCSFVLNKRLLMPKPAWDDFSSSYREHVLDKEEVRNHCLVCGKIVDLPRGCSYCKGVYCEEHYLPELHNCKGLSARDWAAYKVLKMGEKSTLPPKIIEPNYKRPDLFGKRTADTPIQTSTARAREKTKGNIKGVTILKIFMAIFLLTLIGITAFSFIRLSSSQIIKVDKLQVSSNEALSGDSIYVSVSFKSYIDDQGDPIISFVKGIKPLQDFFINYISSKKVFDIKLDGILLTKKDITLNVDKIYNYTFPVLNKTPGIHVISINNTLCEFTILNRSRFDVVDFKIQPDLPSIGEDIVVSVNVTNVGAIVDTKIIQLIVNNVKIKESQINLSPDQYRAIELIISEETAGSYNITLSGLSDKFVNIIQVVDVINPITGVYKNYFLGLIKTPDGVQSNSYGNFTVLINNKNAKNPTYSQLLNFLLSDITDTYQYQYHITISSYYGSAESNVNLELIKEIIIGTKQPYPPRICADFTEMLHNNAERAGIRCAYVTIEVGGSGHALNAFDTTDRGLVYIDDTGIQSDSKYSGSCDKIVDVLKVGSSYIPMSLFPEPGWSSVWENAGTVTSIYMTWDGDWNQ